MPGSSFRYFKNIFLVIICLICMVILKPSRLRIAVEDLSGQGSFLETLVGPWEAFAAKHHLLTLSQVQDELFSVHNHFFSDTGLLPGIIQNNFQSETQASLNIPANPPRYAPAATKLLTEDVHALRPDEIFHPDVHLADDLPSPNSLLEQLNTALTTIIPGNALPVFGWPKGLAQPVFQRVESPFCYYKKWIGQLCLVHGRVPAKDAKIRILLAGDSLMQGLENTLSRFFKAHDQVELYRASVCSTGLSRKDYFDWAAHMAKLVATHDPDLVMIFLGGNDAQDIVDHYKKRHFRGSESWQDLYQKRAENLARMAQSKGAKLLWVGMPIIGSETTEKYIRLLTARQQAACAIGIGRTFIDTYMQLADENGEYTAFLQDQHGRHVRIRLKDKIHLSEAGYKILFKSILPVLEQEIPAMDSLMADIEPPGPTVQVPRTPAEG